MNFKIISLLSFSKNQDKTTWERKENCIFYHSCLAKNNIISVLTTPSFSFYHGLCLKGKPWSCGHPFRTLLSNHLTEQTRTDMSAKVCNWSRGVNFLMTVSWLLKIDCWILIAGNWLLEIDCWKLIAGNWLLEIDCWKLIAWNWLLENDC